MATNRYQPGIYSLNNIDTGTTALTCKVDNMLVSVPPESSITVVARNYISAPVGVPKLEITYIGQIEGKDLGISGNIVSNT